MLAAAGGVGTAHADGRIPGVAAMPNADGSQSATPRKFSPMRTITMEEHYVSPAFASGPGRANNGLGSNGVGASHFYTMLQDLGPGRLAQMDSAGIDVQILGHIPGIEQLEAKEQVPVVRDTNDFLLATVAKHPTRYAGFASVCTAAPQQAAKELERMMQAGAKGAIISGNTGGRYLDDKSFWPILEAAEHLNAPIYLHPAAPPQAVIDACYGGFSSDVVFTFARAGWGWHIDTGIHAIRLILGGVFDQFPKLQLIVGHMGEVLPYMLPRMDDKLDPSLTKLKQPVSGYLRQNFFYTPSGFNFTQNFFDVMTQMGVEKRIMFSADHPFCSMMEARLFLDALPISPADRELIAHGNAERLFNL